MDITTKLSIGDIYLENFQISQKEVDIFAALTGDKNPIHLDEAFAASTKFKQRIVHGTLVTGFFSKLIGMNFPGDGTVFIEQHYKFLAPVFPAEEYSAELKLIEKTEEKNRALVASVIKHRASGKICVEGTVLISNKTRL